MGDEFNVFDDWGNKIGKVRLEDGSGAFGGLAIFLVMVVLWTFGFLIYVFIRLITRGFEALGRGELLKAVAYWTIPLLLFALSGYVYIDAVADGAAQKRGEQRHQGLLDYCDLPSHVRIGNVRRIDCEAYCGGCYYCSGVYIRFTVTNDCNAQVNLAGGIPVDSVGPRETKEFTIFDGSAWPAADGRNLVPVDGNTGITPQICLDATAVLLGFGKWGFVKDEPVTVCGAVPNELAPN